MSTEGQTSDCIKSRTVTEQSGKVERNSKGQSSLKYLPILSPSTRKQVLVSLLLKSVASLAQLDGCYYQHGQLYRSHATGLVECHKVLSCRKEKNNTETEKRRSGRVKVTQGGAILAQTTTTSGGKDTNSDPSIIMLRRQQ